MLGEPNGYRRTTTRARDADYDSKETVVDGSMVGLSGKRQEKRTKVEGTGGGERIGIGKKGLDAGTNLGLGFLRDSV